jgi:hypothetical protein
MPLLRQQGVPDRALAPVLSISGHHIGDHPATQKGAIVVRSRATAPVPEEQHRGATLR